MRKHIFLVLCVAFLLIFASCNLNTIRSNDLDLNFINSEGAYGNEMALTSYEIEGIGIDNLSAELKESYPVFINEYASNQSGRLYEINDTLQSKMKDNLQSYLEILYEDFDSSDLFYYPEYAGGYTTSYNQGNSEFNSTVNGLSVFTTDYNIDLNSKDTDILNNDIVMAAISYMGFNEPIISSRIVYSADGEAYEKNYQIINKSSDINNIMLSNSFAKINLSKGFNEDSLYLSLTQIMELKEEKVYSTLPYEKILSALVKIYPNMDKDSIKAETYYNGMEQPGLYIPSLRIYFKETGNNKYYKMVDVIMVDYP